MKRYISYAVCVLLLAAGVCFGGCDDSAPLGREPSLTAVHRKPVAVTGVTLDRTSLLLSKGDTVTLTATVLPENATDRSVRWSSSDTSVATVSSEGQVTAVSAGTATITATSVSDTGVKAECTVTVAAKSDGQENGHEYVDLGLPSGLLWATCNVGASSPSDYGNYYAWGETTTKSSYTESNYSYSSNPTTLPVDRDAARANWGGSWLMPTESDFMELCYECTWTWTTMGGKNGYKVSSKKNSSYIFLPAAGFFGSSLSSAGSRGDYWSSSLYTSDASGAYDLHFGSSLVNPTNDNLRCFGRSVRPVLRKEVAVTGVTLDRTSLLLSKGDTVTLTATVLPENATDRSVRWSSSDTSVATVSSEGQVTAVSAGTATITATSVSDTGVKAECTVTVAAKSDGQENGHEYVDLGLPSGLLWATCNVGASSPSDYGNYYAWGETTTKNSYTESNYSYSSNPTTLPVDRDAARANWGGSWLMPTKSDFQELYNECTWTWTTMGGKNGYKVSSKKNSSYIFLPAADYFGSSLNFTGSSGFYWSSSLNASNTSNAYALYFLSSVINPTTSFYRYYGQSVRPVLRKEVAVTGVTLDQTSLSLFKGGTATLTATVLPEDATDRSVTWSSSNTSVATVSSDGIVTAVSAGTTTITATSVSDTSAKATCTVTVMNVDGQENGHGYVDLGLTSGTLWATCNVGASSPFDYGNYYAWGETTTKNSYAPLNYSYSSNPTTLPVDRDAARANWGGSWLMPTKSDFQELYNECTWTWTTMDGKNGYKVSSKKNSSYIFLPAAGYFDFSLGNAGSYGNYWSSSLNTSDTSGAYELYFDSSNVNPPDSFSRFYGRSVRPVLRKEVAVTGVTLDQTSLSLFKGGTATLTATVLPEDATDRSVTWTSSDTSVATVSSDGKVKAISAGTATITATSVSDTSVKATCTVTVLEMNVDGQENGHDFVDLGLTSGTLWATCNVGASSPFDYGNYYAWGETATKSSYTESNYSYSSNPTTLPVDRDAARANWGGSWLMPTQSDFQELCNECTWTWTTMNGKNGYKVSSKKNSSYIFLPAAGAFVSSLSNAGSYGYYWSSSLYSSYTSYAYVLFFYSSNVDPSGYSWYGRYSGQSVRPVLRKEVAVTGITLDKTSLSLNKGETATLIATVLPEDATDRSVTWSSSNPSVATVSSDGIVTAVSAGTATVTVTSVSDTSVKATCTVTVTANFGGQENGHGYVDLGLTSGTLWATCNVGASSPTDYGNYYAWGETTTKSSYTSSNYSYSSNPTTLPVDRDAARANWGGSWVMPTVADLNELYNECIWTWTTMNGKNGYKVSSRKNSSYIFLPAAGYFGSSLSLAGSYGSYWSSSLFASSTYAFGLYFNSGNVHPSGDYFRYNGRSVRPVLGKEVAVTGITLDKTSLLLNKGKTATLIATVLPENATDKSVTWSSSNKSVATVSSDGKVTAVSAGTTTVTVTSVSNISVKATCTVTVTETNADGQENGHDYVDLGLSSGTLWATCNVGATSPEEYGNYYAWGETETKSSYTESNYSYSSNPTILPLDRDAAHAIWGGSWIMPTRDDFNELYNECTWTWTTMNGKNGYKVSSKKNSSYIFLPAAGYFGSSLYNAGSSGYYWSSSLYTSGTSYAYELFFVSNYGGPSYYSSRYVGHSVRPVLRK